MKLFAFIFILFFSIVMAFGEDGLKLQAPQVVTKDGLLEGVNESGIYVFKGVPFAAPPIGPLRWRAPQPVKKWEGVRKADKFGPRAMQRPVFGDMNFRSDGMSEDCLYLNVWTPTKSFKEKLPVLVYFYGGGLIAGDGSEPRYDGESMARQGIVAVTVNYRLNIFGFFSHPELTKESSFKASGNYGLLDQHAALKWVQENIAAFGGDPDKVTIAGESAGSFSVSAQMASPLSKGLFRAAIGESGSLLGNRPLPTRTMSEKKGQAFASAIGAPSLDALRAIPADKLIEATARPDAAFSVNIDGYLFQKDPVTVFKSGEQAHVPLLVGWNSEEMNYRALLGSLEPIAANFVQVVKDRFKEDAPALIQVYSAEADQDMEQVATDFAGDQFIAYGTWRWSDLHSKTGANPVYRYLYTRARPAMRAEMGNAVAGLAGGVIKGEEATKQRTPLSKGAVHSAEIEYALGNLPSNRVYDWEPEDYKVSAILQTYFANFVKSGNPNGLGVPAWPTIQKGEAAEVMYIDTISRVVKEKHRDRYLLLEKLADSEK
ncbi:carboxylesterase/lipase family protein [Olivibacter sp. CPCC 100613]|uniref:carboxylesterase/lipase family protein n=1 Tax=Olivibacter sp. CPCC 100613 TaxID=3079931 RepID=UPI002FFA7B0A